MTRARLINLLCAAIGAVAILISIVFLERERAGIERTVLAIGPTPATLYNGSAEAPTVIIAHGFAGSRQLMDAYALTLARAGYRVLSYDVEGHGRHPEPMGGDVTRLDGTTALLVAQTRTVVDHARTLPGFTGELALLGHSMATDVIIRAALQDGDVDALVAVSSFSGAVTASEPDMLLTISGGTETRLRAEALRTARLVDPQAIEGETVAASGTTRRTAVAPYVGHIGVLYAPTALREANAWLDTAFGRSSNTQPVTIGPWILALLGGAVLLFRPLASLLPLTERAAPLPTRRFLIATLAPMLAAPLLAMLVYTPFLPVLVADYLLIHLALLGILQLVLLRPSLPRPSLAGIALLVVWGIAVFGLLLDRYAASFVPTEGRLFIVAMLALGTIPAMVADASLSAAGHAPLWRRVVLRLAFLISLAIPALLDPEGLGFILITFPVLILFFAVHGLMGRWVARRAGATTAGLGLGLILAWAIGVSFPMFAA
ncbi:serine aminopeptidase S33 family [Litoreibacter ponti]|uniref:Serine aminopeptidase S33 family n=1 Tax=Litoreibacter ponti TaxID=1510457 RepID=A0A2T6BF78_9RHOB|nr:alpha/beta hydrolase [Litoreibacter ponti]PTX54715.1 serine aminopeptidase S33 family [Litoreibacter ponti]